MSGDSRKKIFSHIVQHNAEIRIMKNYLHSKMMLFKIYNRKII